MAKSIDELIAMIDAIPDVPAKPGEYILQIGRAHV